MKRACPYDADLLRVRKVHLLNHDVEFSERFKVYEKTLKKLNDGARLVNASEVTDISKTKEEIVIMGPRQKSIESFFRGAEKGVSKEVVLRPNNENSARCAFCDKVSKINKCHRCGEEFCISCSLSIYDSSCENFVCLSCY